MENDNGINTSVLNVPSIPSTVGTPSNDRHDNNNHKVVTCTIT